MSEKHPSLQGKEGDAQQTLPEPDEIRASLRDPAVQLFYRPTNSYHLCVVARILNHEGFLITAYVTDAVKKGQVLWTS